MSRNIPPLTSDLLFATDFSAPSDAASRVALAYARQLGARLHLLHVVASKGEATVLPQLADLARKFGSDVPVVTAVEFGTPAEQIVLYAARHHVGLIVVGTHGRSGFTRVILGSVAERVARTAACPVLTVPHGMPATAAQPEAIALPARPESCLVCAAPSKDLICETCRARIRGEALERKAQEMRAGSRP